MATSVGDMINQGVYHVMIHLKHMSCLEYACRGHHTVKASDVMSVPVVSIKITPTVAEVSELLTSTQHHGFPVVRTRCGGREAFAGLVLRSQLEGLLDKEQFYEEEIAMKSPRRGSVVDTLVSTRNEEHGEMSAESCKLMLPAQHSMPVRSLSTCCTKSYWLQWEPQSVVGLLMLASEG